GLFDPGGNGVVSLGGKTLTITNGSFFNGVIQDGGIGGGTGGSLVIAGGASQDLGGVNTYTGSTTIMAGGTLSVSSLGSIASSSGLSLAGTGATFDISGSSGSQTIKDLSGVAGSTITLGSNTLAVGTANSTTFAGSITGDGGLVKQGTGTLTLSGASTYLGGTTVNAGKLVVNGSLVSTVTINSGGMLGGTGTIGGLVSNGAVLTPGNSIGTLNVTGNFSQVGGVYQVEANAAGQADRINVGGTATITGGATVQVQAQPGNYGRSTTYTIVRAAGGVIGTYSGVTSNFAFLTPSLSYDANDVFLTLSMGDDAFSSPSFVALTPNQRAVGRVLDRTFNSASGDYATVLNAIAGASTAQGPQLLDMISG